MNYTIPTIEWYAILPIAIVVVTGIVALFVELLRPKGNNSGLVVVSLLGLVVAAVVTVLGFGSASGDTFGGMATHDVLGSGIELIVLVVTGLAILFSEGYLREKKIAFGEFYPLMLWSASGAMMMATTRNLLMVFIGLEVLSVSLYVLAGLSRSEEKSEESAIKYFLLGAFASGFFLYGLALFYGATGSLHFEGVRTAIDAGDVAMPGLLLAALGLLTVGLSFKSGLVPFHQWTPDVYQGAPTNVAAFMSAVAKLGALSAMWRLLSAFAPNQAVWMPALMWIAILTIVVGNLAAVVQKDVKRILGYSSIAQAGYMMVAVLAHAKQPALVSDFVLLYYLLGYGFMTIGAFAIVSLTARGGKEGTRLDDLRGLARRSPFAAICLIVFMVSMIGLPPTVGFVGKLLIFNAAMQAGLAPLAIVLAIGSAVSCYYYLAIVWAVLKPEVSESKPWSIGLGVRTACGICAAGVLLLALFVGPLESGINGKRRADVAAAVAEEAARPHVHAGHQMGMSATGAH